MKITVYTDGSMKNKVCAWAAHISYNDNSHLLSGNCPRFIKFSSQAETYAVLKAIQAVKALEPSVKHIEINTDLLGLKYRLDVKGKRTKNYVSKTLQDKIVSEAQGCGITLTVNFVKAHQKRYTCPRGELNHLVDFAARSKRKEFQKEQESQSPSKISLFLEFLSFKYETNFLNNLAFYWEFLHNRFSIQTGVPK